MTEKELTVDKTTIFKFLLETGCCKRCALRFIGDDANFNNPEAGVKISYPGDQNGQDGHTLKRSKTNPCIICLDLLQDVSFQSMIFNSELERILEYDCDTFVNYISFPMSILIREHSMELYAKEKFPTFFEDSYIVPVNKAWSLSMQNKLSEKLGKTFDKNSVLQIQFTTTYELEKEESSIMYDVESKLKRLNGQKSDALSRNVIAETLKSIDPELFRKHVSIPPESPSKTVMSDHVSCKHDSIFIAGRYCKFSRKLFQTPWLHGGEEEEIIKNSVQEIIFKSLGNIFNCSSLVFSSSGREDFDVRMLGTGRPFFIKVCDPKITKISSEKFRLIEESIRGTSMVAVRNLQIIDRKYINNVKEGEQFKQKTYRALCIVNNPESLTGYIDKINTTSKVTLQQKTPLRVYHRRSTDIREREIYSIKARPITGRENLFELDMVTQAGTYVKEFVHGDLGRTRPSLSEIIGGYVDILALDVLDIDLDFPPPIIEKMEIDQVSQF